MSQPITSSAGLPSVGVPHMAHSEQALCPDDEVRHAFPAHIQDHRVPTVQDLADSGLVDCPQRIGPVKWRKPKLRR